jgi:hypothetical protein
MNLLGRGAKGEVGEGDFRLRQAGQGIAGSLPGSQSIHLPIAFLRGGGCFGGYL